MALADGHSELVTGPLSLHTRTAIHFVGQLSGAKFTVTPLSEQLDADNQPMLNRIECEGIAFEGKKVVDIENE